MKAATNIKTPTRYIDSLTGDRRAVIRALHNAIRKAAPSLKPHMAHGMIGYESYHHRYASGREGDASVVALASQKQHISLYICIPVGTDYLPEKNKTRLGKVSVGESCIRFKRLEDLNPPVALRLVKQAAKLSRTH
jgi:Domain of unknown function (DU1801)